MRTITQLNKKLAFALGVVFTTLFSYGQTSTYTTTGTHTFTAPAGVTNVTVEVWGAGGRGGTRTSTYACGGGGGGAYSRQTNYAVTPNADYTVEVGEGSSDNATPGGDSYFVSATTVMAKGGNSVSNNSLTGASGGAAASGFGATRYSGGDGANGVNTGSRRSGGGGSSAGTGTNGADATNATGANAPTGGGDGGNGRTSNSDGQAGDAPGGGGGGAYRSGGSQKNGGTGGDGQVRITYTCPTYALTAAPSSSNVCANSAATVTLRSSSMPSGTYTVTYNLTGATVATGNTATMTFTAGAPGTGTFTTSNLAQGSNTITVTNIASGTSCDDNIATFNIVFVTATAAPTANAGTAVSTCATSGSVNVTAGATATNSSSVTWTSSGTGSFTNPNSLTTCTYNPSAADILAGSVTLTLSVNGIAPCAAVATSNKTLTIRSLPTAVAGANFSTCISASAINITAGASATNQSSVLWTSSGTGTFTNATSLTLCTYNPSPADELAGSVTLTLTANATAPCTGNAVSTKTLTIVPNPSSNPGSPITTCATDGAINITGGANASFYTTVLWTSSGTGTFTNANSISTCTYNPSAADRTAGSVTLTLTAMSPGCTNGVSNKTLTILPAPAAVAGTNISTCAGAGAVNITAGSSAANYTAIAWTSSGTGTFANANSLTTCTYDPSAADITSGSVTLTLTVTGNSPCTTAVSTKTVTINNAVTADAGTALSTCSTSGAINITDGASATNYTSVLWTSSGSGTFTNANSLTACTYNPSAADRAAGSVLLTLTATNAGCGSNASTKTLTIYATPTITGTVPATRTGPGTVILGATASIGTLYWYDVPTGGTPLGFGTSFTTPFISSTTTFYVESTNGTCTSTPRTPVVATILFSEVDIRGNGVSITDGDATPSVADFTDFGSTNMTRTYTIHNIGAGVLSVGSVLITGTNASEFTVTSAPNGTVASGQSTSFTITFAPTAAGLRTASLKIATNDVDESNYDFAIQGTGVNKEIDIQGNATTILDGDVSPALTDWTDFGSVTATRTYTIRNLGNIVLNIGSFSITGVDAADFAVTTPPAATVGAYGTTTFVITFTPSVIGDRNASFQINNDDSNESNYDFAIHGYGIIPEIDIRGNAVSIVDNDSTPTTADWTDFGNATVTRTYTIYNQGNTLLNIGAITFSGTNASEFSVTTPPVSPVTAFSSTTFTVTFAPTATGTRTAAMSIVNNDATENPYNFSLQGTGVAQEIRIRGNNVTISDGDTTPDLNDWTDYGTVALQRTYTIFNLGNLPLTLGGITFSGTNPGDFSVTTSPGSSVAAFSSNTFVVTFNPGGIGTRSAMMNIPNNDSDENPYNFNIQGTGGVPEINIRSQYNVNIADGDVIPSPGDQTDFGNVSMDGGSVTVNVIIQNTGTGAMSIGAASFTGANASDFAIVTPPASTIAAGGSSRFKISFTPTTIGLKTATFSIVNNDSNENPYDFALQGTGVQTYKDTDADGVTDNKDVDDDNDGIIDIQEQTDGLSYPLTGLVNYVFLNETFGAGTTKGLININTPGASCTYCYEDGYGSACDASVTLEDGEYVVTYKITGATASDPENIHGDLAWYDGLDHTTGDTNGRMAVFNASYAAGTFYETRVDGVIPNVPISYSFWVLNIMRQSNYGGSIRPNITVEFVDLNGNLLSSFDTGFIGRCTMDPNDNTCFNTNWLPFSTSVNLGNITSFIVRFKNNSTGGGGNDLALDDIVIAQNYIDTDGDGVANIFDLDDENDGIPDIEEAGFKDFSNGLSKMDMSSPMTWSDVNANGLHDYIDSLVDGFAYWIPDTDYDSVPDYLDLDSDNDSLFDVDEAGLFNGDGDINGDGKGDLADTDRDGILDLYDNNVGFGTNVRPYAEDIDYDNIPNYLQLDSDWDGITDIQTGLYGSLDTDYDGMIDGFSDIDKDGITDTFDTNTAVIGSPRDLNRKLYLNFDGRNDYGSSNGVLGGLSNVTMMAWVNLNPAFAGNGVIVGQDRFQLRINSSRQLDVQFNGTTITHAATTLNTAQWYHVGVTLGGGQIKLYINGVNVMTNSASGSIAADATLLTLGKNPAALNNYFSGKIDEVRIFNTNLTDAQFQRVVYQEVQNNSSQVRGAIVPKNVGSLPWANVLRYFRMDAYKDDIIDDLTTASIDAGAGMRIYNHKLIAVQQAPMPFVTERSGTFAVAVDSPTNEVRGLDIMDQDWSIVQVNHDINETANNVDLGMFVDPAVTIVADNDIKIQNDWYLKLDGKIDLKGKSQLVQTIDSDLALDSAGLVERDQQGQSNHFNYNYWCAPVGNLSTTQNNTNFSANSVMRDGTDPDNIQNINFVSGYNGSPTSPISIAGYWIFKFQNTSPVYANWSAVGPNGTLLAGQGYTMKGSGAASPTQNFTFSGKPNNATISSPIAANNLNLSGNPYASALDADAFIIANTASTTGTLYFWEHFSTNNTHVLANYQGGYATRNLVGGTPPVSPAEVSGLGSSTRIPGRFIPVGQGFFVTGSAVGGNITFTNAQRTFIKEDNANSNFMFRVDNQAGPRATVMTGAFDNSEDTYTESEYAKLRIGYTSPENFHRQLLIGFMDDLATSDVDPGYDAPHIDNQPSDMYFLNGATKLIIQGEGYFNENNSYPIGVKVAAAGTIKFMLDGMESFEDGQQVYIYDNTTATYHSILNDEVFSVDVPAGTTEGRFSLRFKTEESLDNQTFDAAAAITTMYTSDDSMITVRNNSLDATVESVMLFNMLGQEVAQWEITAGNQKNIQIPVRTLSTGTYIVKVITTKGDLSKKIIIK